MVSAVEASVPSIRFMSKNFVVTLLKFTSNTQTVIGNILLKPVSLEPSNIKLYGISCISLFNFSRKMIS